MVTYHHHQQITERKVYLKTLAGHFCKEEIRVAKD